MQTFNNNNKNENLCYPSHFIKYGHLDYIFIYLEIEVIL